jgi:glutamate synthase (NADPH/NADH) small chain
VIQERQTPMREQASGARIHNFDEVPLGYSEAEAIQEAERCLQCKDAPCVAGCPVGIDIPRFIEHVRRRRFAEAIAAIKEDNALPAVCGRVCPQENQCEGACTLGKRFEPVAIGRLERACADWEANHDPCCPGVAQETGKRAAVIGSGPAGLTAAGELRRYGHDVTIFELLHVPGGVLVYGIPEFRLPKAIVAREIETLRRMGVKIEVNRVIGRICTVDDLLDRGYDVVFIGTGAGLPRFLGIPGENLNGVYTANEFLTRANLMRAYRFPEYDTPIKIGTCVVTIGGGNTAMDSSRTALRLGAEASIVVYRRSEDELPARREELHHAKQEGIQFQLLTSPIEFLGKEGRLRAIRCVRMELGATDDSGRPRPVPVPDSEFEIEADTAIIGIGNGPHPLVLQTTEGLRLNREGNIVAAPDTGRTSKERVFAGGDIVTGTATVIEAMGAGKRSAAAIHEWLTADSG